MCRDEGRRRRLALRVMCRDRSWAGSGTPWRATSDEGRRIGSRGKPIAGSLRALEHGDMPIDALPEAGI